MLNLQALILVENWCLVDSIREVSHHKSCKRLKTSFLKNIGNYAKINLTGIHDKSIVFNHDWFDNRTKVYHDLILFRLIVQLYCSSCPAKEDKQKLSLSKI